MIIEVIKINIDQIVKIEEFTLVVGFNMQKIEVDLDMNKITGMIIWENISEVTWKCIKISEDRIVEEDIEEIIEIKTITEKEVGVVLESTPSCWNKVNQLILSWQALLTFILRLLYQVWEKY